MTNLLDDKELLDRITDVLIDLFELAQMEDAPDHSDLESIATVKALKIVEMVRGEA